MAKHVLFDIDDTLFPSSEFSSLARRNALNAMMGMGLPGPYGKLECLLKAIIGKRGSNYQGHFDDLCKALKIRYPARYVAAAIAAYHDTKAAIQPFPAVQPMLTELRRQGYYLYVATNGNPLKQWDKLIRLRLANNFDGVFISGEIGAEKGTAFYRAVLRLIRAAPGDCVMVGDREDADIRPAKAVGMRTVRILAGKHAAVPTKADFAIPDISGLAPALKSL